MRLEAPDYVVLIVSDLDRAVDFYTGVLGLRLGHRSGPYAQLDTGTTRLAFYERPAMASMLERDLAPSDPAAPAFEIGFKVPDVDAAFGELVSAGAEAAAEPRDRPWGSAPPTCATRTAT